jgi:nitrate/nitrite transporter NarK
VFALAALVAIVILTRIGTWYTRRNAEAKVSGIAPEQSSGLSSRRIAASMAVLIALVFSKYVYLASLVAYYTFFLIARFHVSVRSSQVHLFVFLGAVAAGTIIGGPVGDRFGRKYVIWCSILGVLPFTLVLPSGLRVFGHPGVCAGTGSGQSRHGLGPVLRAGVRYGRGRSGGVGQTGRRHEHRIRLQGLLVPAGNRPAHRVSAEFGNSASCEKTGGLASTSLSRTSTRRITRPLGAT